MKIGIVGWYGKQNIGDEAFRDVFAEDFVNHNLRYYTPPGTPHDCDVYILGGGNVASPFYLKQMFDYLPKDSSFYGLGIGIGYESEIDLLAQRPFKEIYLRNKNDVYLARHKCSFPVNYTPDLAFRMSVKHQITRRWNGKKRIAVIASDYINPAIDRPVSMFGMRAYDFQVKLAADLDVLTEQGWDVLLMPCSTAGYGDDRRIMLGIASFMKNRPGMILDSMQPQDMIDILSGQDVTLCMRFHSVIFSVIAGTPPLAINHTRKVGLFMEENGLGDLIVGRFDDDHYIDVRDLVGLANDKADDESLRSRLGVLALDNRNQVKEVMRTVRRCWLGEGC